MTAPLLRVEGLAIEFDGPAGSRRLVDDVSFDVTDGGALGLVGESASGKSLTLRALSGVLPAGFRVAGGRIELDGVDLLALDDRDRAKVQGAQVGLVFQDALSALNPVRKVGAQLAEGPRLHFGWSRARARDHAVEMLDRVGLRDAERAARSYPHQLSGGQRQRATIAMALMCEPRVLLCDEPTSALDTTTQARLLALLERLRAETGVAIVFVSHDLAVVRGLCDRVAVMYAGRLQEVGPVEAVFADPRHAYTRSLLDVVPELGPTARLPTSVPGEPGGIDLPGCRFHARCRFAQERCRALEHRFTPVAHDHVSACIHARTGFRPPVPAGTTAAAESRRAS